MAASLGGQQLPSVLLELIISWVHGNSARTNLGVGGIDVADQLHRHFGFIVVDTCFVLRISRFPFLRLPKHRHLLTHLEVIPLSTSLPPQPFYQLESTPTPLLMADPAPFPILRTVHDVRQWRGSLPDPSTLGFVPTMGALHEGHLQLVRHSLSSQQYTVVSIFLNPTQFGPSEDLSSYPSTLQADLEKLAALNISPGSYDLPHQGFDGRAAKGPGLNSTLSNADNVSRQSVEGHHDFRRVSAVFLPTSDVLYPSGITTERGTFVTVHGLSEQLEGARRPGFFRGVATVVLKLFLIVEPSLAFFGQKDLQQCLLIRQMSMDLHIIRPKSIVAVPTVRDTSTGLALSSRNSYLSPSELDAAKVLFTFLRQCADRLISSEGTLTIEELSYTFKSPIRSISLDFVSLNDPITFHDIPPRTKIHPNLAIAISGAVLVNCDTGRIVRLIDNIVINYDLNHFI